MIAILDKTCYTALKNHARTYSIFSALRQEKSPPCAMLFCSKALHLTRHAIFSFNVQFCPRLYLLSTLLFDIFNTTSRKIPPPLCNVVPLKSTTFNKTHAIFSFNVQFCPTIVSVVYVSRLGRYLYFLQPISSGQISMLTMLAKIT